MRISMQSDQELIVLFLQGHEKSFEVIIQRHKSKIFTAILLKVRDQYIAEDIFQDTFIRAIDTLRAGKYNDEGKFLPWIMRIAYNLCIDHFRKIKRMPKIHSSDGEDVFSFIKTEDVPQECHWDLVKGENQLKEIIELLPPDQKEVLMLRHYFDFNFKEIAEYTNSSLNTCLGRMRYAIINLRKLIEKHDIKIDRAQFAVG